MESSDPKVTEFLAAVQSNDGEEVRRLCEEIIEELPPDSEIRPFNVLAEAKLRTQEPQLQDLAAMNAAAFDSARDKPDTNG